MFSQFFNFFPVQEDASLKYLFRPAQDAQDGGSPMLFLLHGLGSNEEDLFAFSEYIDPHCAVVSLRAPHQYQLGGYKWFDVAMTQGDFQVNLDDVDANLGSLFKCIYELIEKYAGNKQRIYIGGFSQGAIMALLAGMNEPQTFAGVLSLSGRLNPDMQDFFAEPSKFANFPIFMQHGIYDTTIPIEAGRSARDLLKTYSTDLEYHEYEMGHEVTSESLTDMLAWINTKLAAANESEIEG